MPRGGNSLRWSELAVWNTDDHLDGGESVTDVGVRAVVAGCEEERGAIRHTTPLLTLAYTLSTPLVESTLLVGLTELSTLLCIVDLVQCPPS